MRYTASPHLLNRVWDAGGNQDSQGDLADRRHREWQSHRAWQCWDAGRCMWWSSCWMWTQVKSAYSGRLSSIYLFTVFSAVVLLCWSVLLTAFNKGRIFFAAGGSGCMGIEKNLPFVQNAKRNRDFFSFSGASVFIQKISLIRSDNDWHVSRQRLWCFSVFFRSDNDWHILLECWT